ncbi:MAG: head maturation protease, ClpP-related, partial [Sneathiella sp.]
MALEIKPPKVSLRWEIAADASKKWHPVQAAKSDDRSISIYDGIGEQWDGSGTTVKRISAALRGMGAGDVTVNVNSPGGDMFEGLSIYNTLKAHDGKVTVNVLGIAASAASLIAMAADELRIAESGFLMIHNAWSGVMGNRHDFQDAADIFQKFDNSMAGLYAKRTDKTRTDMAKLMDAETYLTGAEAIEQGFADSFLPTDEIEVVKD